MIQISGLKYVPNYLSKENCEFLLKAIYDNEWMSELSRRVQHYGYKYDYRSRAIDMTMKGRPFPNWAILLTQRLKKDGYIKDLADQLIVNEYLSGQGIANHIDCEPCFGDTIASISLGSSCIMNFVEKNSKNKVELLLEPCSLLVLSGQARYKWTHGINKRLYDQYKSEKLKRTTRVSLTFRKVILSTPI
ncbi:alpha-ketoglutarate-dependent dioxygenase AlkB [Rapidithrix thailandica]|uniref:Alpha-ketoglutarate-dependent dioxygenase AlkB n=1 Tax=Rapidithrix thailandica TaxID=413964 RepID=A0AAW9SLQ8_9BACT